MAASLHSTRCCATARPHKAIDAASLACGRKKSLAGKGGQGFCDGSTRRFSVGRADIEGLRPAHRLAGVSVSGT